MADRRQQRHRGITTDLFILVFYMGYLGWVALVPLFLATLMFALHNESITYSRSGHH